MQQMKISRRRGELDECIHYVDVVAVDSQGKIVYQKGDAGKYTYFRSSAKPIQAMSVLLSGAYAAFGLNERELAVICSSHFAEDFHTIAVKSILAKIGLDEGYLKCGASRSIKSEFAFAQAEMGLKPQSLFSDCSGKHAGMLAICKAKDWDTDTYLLAQHPVQKLNLDMLAQICRYPADKITLGVDGCGVPVFALPIQNMAWGFARMATGADLPVAEKDAAAKIFEAMNRYPEMVSGTGGFCSALLKATGGRLLAKAGAMGVYAIGLKEEKLGIALKVSCGTPGISAVAALQCLLDLDLLSKAEYQDLQSFHTPDILNDAGLKVGETVVLS